MWKHRLVLIFSLSYDSGVTGISYLRVKNATNLTTCEIIQVDFLRTVLHGTELSPPGILTASSSGNSEQ